MSRHFITVLGTSLYTDCIYEVEGTGFGYQTPFVQMAVLKYIMPIYAQGDRITVLLTEKSEEKNWYTREYTETERKQLAARKMEPTPGEQKTGLKDMMEKEYPDIQIENVRIKEGRNKAEIDEIFESIYEVIDPEETIYFDFTHGLRNLPMQALTVIHYAKALKNIQVGGMYYGAFELGEKKEDGCLHVNLLDMLACSTILDWTSAAESFIKGGSSNQIKELYHETVNPRKEQQNTTKMMNKLCDLTNCLNTCRGKSDKNDKKSIQTAYDRFDDAYINICKDEKPVSEAPLLRLLDYIREDVKNFNRKCYALRDGKKIDLKDTATGMAAVKWAIDKNLTQQGYTALEETIKTYLCEAYEFPEIPAEIKVNRKLELVRDKIVGRTVKLMSKRYNDLKNDKNGKTALDFDAVIREREADIEGDAQLAEWEPKNKTLYLHKMGELVRTVPKELVDLSWTVSDQRNTLNHFGFQEYPTSYDKLQKNLVKLYEEMQIIMEQDNVIWEN